MEDVKGFEIHNPVSFENLTGKLWAKVVRNFGTVELSMKADSIEFQLIKEVTIMWNRTHEAKKGLVLSAYKNSPFISKNEIFSTSH